MVGHAARLLIFKHADSVPPFGPVALPLKEAARYRTIREQIAKPISFIHALHAWHLQHEIGTIRQ